MWAFREQTQPHHVLAAAIRAAKILGMLLDEESTRIGGMAKSATRSSHRGRAVPSRV